MSFPSPELIVSVSGIRGIVGKSLTPDVTVRFAQAYGSHLGAGSTVLLSRDGRPSGDMLGYAVTAGLLAVGCEVQDLGIAPTPTIGRAVRTCGAKGAIQISASHNPAEWNGLKMFGSDGAVLPANVGKAIQDRFEKQDFSRVAWDGFRLATDLRGMQEEHANAASELADVPLVTSAGFRVLVDGNGGSGGPVAVPLLEKLGCWVFELNTATTGEFAHEAEPIPAHLQDVAKLVRQEKLQVGFVLDPDADRLALIDERGECVSEEATLALAVKYRLLQSPGGTVVINMSTSRMCEDLATASGGTCVRTAVGEANVVAGMRKANALIGGEGNGGVIDPRLGWVRDPFAGMSAILSLMAKEQKPLSQLVAELPRYSMLKTKFPVAREKLVAALAAIREKWSDATADTTDGLRLAGPDWWLHVRPSNTEPVVRVIAESPTAERTKQLCDDAAALVLGSGG